MSDQTQSNDQFGYEVWVPLETPGGQSVSVQSGERAGRHIMHAESPDQSEFYFEVFAYEECKRHADLAQQQRAYLGDNSPDGETTEPEKGTLHHLEGMSFEFRGTMQSRWKERRFFFVDGSNRTYRVVHDPTSDLNVKAFQSLRLK